jgi:hypothetical protein
MIYNRLRQNSVSQASRRLLRQLSKLHRTDGYANFIKLVCDHKTLERYECTASADGTTINTIENIVKSLMNVSLSVKSYVFDDTEQAVRRNT